jgi:hypothetical protein
MKPTNFIQIKLVDGKKIERSSNMANFTRILHTISYIIFSSSTSDHSMQLERERERERVRREIATTGTLVPVL